MTTPFHSILVPLDGSGFAEQALPLAAHIAHQSGAMLQVARVHDPIPPFAGSMDAPGAYAGIDQEMRTLEQEYLSGVVARATQEIRLPVSSILLDGPVASALAEYAQRGETDLVVMTTHGRSGFSRFWLGSVADQLIRRLSLPIILLRPADAQPQPPPPLRQILVTLDGSEFAEKVFPPVLALANACQAELRLISVILPPVPLCEPISGVIVPAEDQLIQALRDQAEVYLSAHMRTLCEQGFRVTTRALVSPVVATGILQEAEACGADLIATATHGKGGARRLMLGSVADKVVRGAHRPVLVVKGKAGEQD